jgi:hypothetical protein
MELILTSTYLIIVVHTEIKSMTKQRSFLRLNQMIRIQTGSLNGKVTKYPTFLR